MTDEKEISLRICGQTTVFLSGSEGISANKSRFFEADGRLERSGEPPSAEVLCGIGKLLWDRGVREDPVFLYGDGHPIPLLRSVCEEKVIAVTADVGQADFSPRRIPIRFETPLIGDPVTLKAASFRLTAVNFGDPYAVIFPTTVGDCRLFDRWKEIAEWKVFPKGANVLFGYVREETTLYLRVFHRNGERSLRLSDLGVGLAAAVAEGRCLPDRAVVLPVGDERIRGVCTKDRHVFLTCPVSEIS